MDSTQRPARTPLPGHSRALHSSDAMTASSVLALLGREERAGEQGYVLLGCLSPAPVCGVCVCLSTPACASCRLTLSLSVKFVPLFL